MRERAEIEARLGLAAELDAQPHMIWPLRYQDGVARTLAWMLGEGPDPLDFQAEIPARMLDLRHRLPGGWRDDFETLRVLLPNGGRGGWPTTVIGWLPSFLRDAVPLIIREVFSCGDLEIDDRLGQHVLAVGEDWLPWHTHGFDDSFVSFVLYPFTHDGGGKLRLSSGDTFFPREGHAVVFDGRASAHCVTEMAPGETRYSIAAFYRTKDE